MPRKPETYIPMTIPKPFLLQETRKSWDKARIPTIVAETVVHSIILTIGSESYKATLQTNTKFAGYGYLKIDTSGYSEETRHKIELALQRFEKSHNGSKEEDAGWTMSGFMGKKLTLTRTRRDYDCHMATECSAQWFSDAVSQLSLGYIKIQPSKYIGNK